MRVLIAVHHYPPNRVGGAELLAQRQASWLQRQGIEIRVVCVENISFGAQQISWVDDVLDGIPVRRLNLQYPDQDAGICAAFADNQLTERFGEWIGEWQPDLVHLISGYLLGTAPLRAAKSHNTPAVVTLTDFWFLCPTIQLLKGDGTLCTGPEPLECARCLYDSRRIFRTIDRIAPSMLQAFWKVAAKNDLIGDRFDLSPLLGALEMRPTQLMEALNKADAMLAVTNFLAEMYRANGLTSQRLEVKPNGLQLDTFEPATPHVPGNEIVFGYMGQISPIKGIDILIRAYRLVREANPIRKMRLRVYGKLNAEANYIRMLQALTEGDSSITFAGTYEHGCALQILSEMDALVVPSTWYENAPIVIQEAFAIGTPVVGTNVGGIAELVQDQENGLLFERGDATDLARKLQRFIDEPQLGLRLRANMPPVRAYEQDMDDLMKVYMRVTAELQQETA